MDILKKIFRAGIILWTAAFTPALVYLYIGRTRTFVLIYASFISIYLTIGFVLGSNKFAYEYLSLFLLAYMILVYVQSLTLLRKAEPNASLVTIVIVAVISFTAIKVMKTAFRYQAYVVPSIAMMPSIKPKDVVIADHWAYSKADIKRGDVVVIKYPLDPNVLYVKRIIGLGNDDVNIDREGSVRLNGDNVYSELAEEVPIDGFLPKRYRTAGSGTCKVYSSKIFATNFTYAQCSDGEVFYTKVPESTYFVLGDNRKYSSDSRTWGTLPREKIVGKMLYNLTNMYDQSSPIAFVYRILNN